jgi:hypothetical protein
MATAALDPEFRPLPLRDRIVAGARRDDPVRLHGAIVAALELYPPLTAVEQIFTPARWLTSGTDEACPLRSVPRRPIAVHLRSWPGGGAQGSRSARGGLQSR